MSPLLDDPTLELPHMKKGWIKSIRTGLRRLGGQLWIEDLYGLRKDSEWAMFLSWRPSADSLV